MGWSDQVHANRIQSTNRKNHSLQSNIPTPTPRKPNASVFPIALVAGAVSSAIWWRKAGHKNFKGKDPVGELAAFVKRLLGGSGKKLAQSQSGNWKSNRPGNMAAAAATQRAQASTSQQSSTSQASQKQGGGAKKKNKKKKRKH